MEQINALFTNLLNIGIGVAVAVAAFFVMWGAFLYMSAAGSRRGRWRRARPRSSTPLRASRSCCSRA